MFHFNQDIFGRISYGGFCKDERSKEEKEKDPEVLIFPSFLSLGRNKEVNGNEWDVHMIIGDVIWARPWSVAQCCGSMSTATMQPGYHATWHPYRWERATTSQ